VPHLRRPRSPSRGLPDILSETVQAPIRSRASPRGPYETQAPFRLWRKTTALAQANAALGGAREAGRESAALAACLPTSTE
jgi:hypothetical protein